MAKQELLKLTGTITEALSNAMFRVKLDINEVSIIAQASGKIRLNRIRLVLGDLVEIEMSPMDLTKGRISRRL
jgi:translation initiation factor IF-1